MSSSGISDKHSLLLVGTSYLFRDVVDTSSVAGKPTYVLNSEETLGTLKTFKELPNSVPTIGEPANDNLLTAGVGSAPDSLPALPVGRISADTPEQVLAYLSKVIEYEQDTTNSNWKKKVLHLSDHDLSTSYAGNLTTVASKVTGPPFSGSVIEKHRVIPGPSNVPESVDIDSIVNAGIGVMTYYGHGTALKTNFDFGYASDVSRGYNNKGKYPINIYAACGVGNVFIDRPAQHVVSDWLLTPDKGAVAALALSTYGYASFEDDFLPVLYNGLFKNVSDANSTTFGTSILNVYRQFYEDHPNEGQLITNVIHERILFGDPALRILRVDPSCKSSNQVAGGVTSGQSDSKQAENLLVASNVIAATASAKYHAGIEVKLANNFVVKSGGIFRGYI
jgi:hypothetical protein